MKIREALANWSSDDNWAIIAIGVLKRKGLKGKRLKDFVSKYAKISDDELKDLLSKAD